jgi:hypothetical protein
MLHYVSNTIIVEESGVRQRYGIAFGVKRGACSHPCECTQYMSQDGGPCAECGHFPARHMNIGRADESSEAGEVFQYWK